MPFNNKIFVFAALAMFAFAGNSILNRYALAGGGAGAWGFTLIRLLSGTVMLALLTRFRIKGGSWAGAISLLVYAAGFSFGYLALDTGIGALILFTMVQLTMMGRGAMTGERLSLYQWLGALIAFGAMVWLLWPVQGVPDQAIPLWAVVSMSAAGIGWGMYSLIGRGAAAPLLATTGNFARAALIALVLSLPIFLARPEAWPNGPSTLAAIASGAITSGIGYALWYTALPGLTRTKAGILQLSVPAIAAIGGVILLGEVLTTRLAISALLILAGVSLVILTQRQGGKDA